MPAGAAALRRAEGGGQGSEATRRLQREMDSALADAGKQKVRAMKAEAALAELTKAYDAASGERGKLKAALKQLEAEFAQVQSEATAYEGEVAHMSQRLQRSSDTSGTALADTRAKLSKAHEELAAALNDALALSEENAALRAKGAAASVEDASAATASRAELAELRGALAAAEQRAKIAEASAARQREAAAEGAAQLAAVRLEVSKLRTGKADAAAAAGVGPALAQAAAELATVRAELAASESRVRELEADTRSASTVSETELIEATRLLDTMRQQLEAAQTEGKSAKLELAKTQLGAPPASPALHFNHAQPLTAHPQQ